MARPDTGNMWAGVVRNNVVFTTAAVLTNPDANIALWIVCDAEAVHNTAFSTVAPSGASIETNIAGTVAHVKNNLASHNSRVRNGAGGLWEGNVIGAPGTIFVDSAAGDLRLLAPSPGLPLSPGEADFDFGGQARDLGADQFSP